MKVSELTPEYIAGYCRYDDETIKNFTNQERQEFETFRTAAVAFVCNETGLKKEELDLHEDITTVVLVLCQDMNDNRTMYVDKNNLNYVVSSILGHHSVNLL